MGLFTPYWMSDKIEKAQKAVEKETDTKKLLEIAQSAKHSEIRVLAVKKLHRQSDIIEIIYSCNWESVHMAALEKLEDQTTLEEVAKSNKLDHLRKIAVLKLENQHVIAYIAENDPNLEMQSLALLKLTDQATLTNIAKNASESARLRAAEKLEDKALAQEVYADLATNQTDIVSLQKAIQKLTDQSMLNAVANNASSISARVMAAGKLSDQVFAQNLLLHLSKDCAYNREVDHDKESIRNWVAEMVADQTLLADIAKNANGSVIRKQAVKKLTDQSILADVAINAPYGGVLDICEIALNALTDQAMIVNVAKNAVEARIRLLASDKLKDQNIAQEVYANIAQNTVNQDSVRMSAALKLTSETTAQDVYADIAINGEEDDEDDDSRSLAILKLTNFDVLREIMNGSKEKYIYSKYKRVYIDGDGYHGSLIEVDLCNKARERLAELEQKR